MSGLLASLGCLRAADLINRLLRHDPAAAARLAQLNGRTLQIECELAPLPAAVVSVRFHGDGLELEPERIDAPSLCVRGPAIALLALAASAPTDAPPAGLAVDGDAALFAELRHQWQELAIDWEGLAAQWLGDVPAHWLGKSLRQTHRWGRDLGDRAQVALDELVREEATLGAPLHALAAGVDALARAAAALGAWGHTGAGARGANPRPATTDPS